MKPGLKIAAVLVAVGALVVGSAEPLYAQVDGLSSCQRSFDLDPTTPEPNIGACSVTGIVFLGAGQQTFFDIAGSARAIRTSDADVYDVQVTLSASGDFPDGFLFGHGEVRSTNGDVCGFDMSGAFVGATCEGMFSSDGIFTIFVDAFSGALPE
jgi:hypothetical protein